MDLDQLSMPINEWASNHPEILKIHIFGSRATYTNMPDSDLDIAIELDSSIIPDTYENTLSYWIFNYSNWAKELKPLIPLQLDLQLYEPGYSKRVCSGTVATVYSKSS